VKFRILHNLYYLWNNKNSLFHFSLTQFGEIVSQIRESLSTCVQSFNKDLLSILSKVFYSLNYTSCVEDINEFFLL
jgi:hypothetical protein